MKNIKFQKNEFNYFSPDYKRSKEINKLRLNVKRKFAEIGKILIKDLKKVVDVKPLTSLHHPYIYNRFAVESIWLYFTPKPDTYKELSSILGKELSKDLTNQYNHTLLIAGIEYNGLFISLKIHPSAWWDGQNIKNKCKDKAQCEHFVNLLREHQNFYLRLHEWPRKYECHNIKVSHIHEFFKYYTPGEHWFHLNYDISKEMELATSETFSELVKKTLIQLIPLYKFIKWTPDNNYVEQFR